jgi:hypothetical protein
MFRIIRKNYKQIKVAASSMYNDIMIIRIDKVNNVPLITVNDLNHSKVQMLLFHRTCFLAFISYFPLIQMCLHQWFSTFFSSHRTKDHKKFGGTIIPKFFVNYLKSIFFQKKNMKSKE